MPTHQKGDCCIVFFPYCYILCGIRCEIRFRSSDSAKYGTNKSSGASVTSGHQQKHLISSITHDSVSNRKPPMHPNHHQCNYNNHRITSIPVHNSNNRLTNNTVFHNNQYTFSLNRIGDGGYLDPRPLSAASLYGDGQRITRGTKSDIGVPCRRQSTSKALLHSSGVHKSKLPSVKSDFLLSYLNNNSKPNECTNSSAYQISGVSTSDYLETYKTGAKRLYSSSSKLEHINLHANRTANNKQQNGTSNIAKQSSNVNSNVGPLLYLDSFEHFKGKPAFSNAQYQSMQSVSKNLNA